MRAAAVERPGSDTKIFKRIVAVQWLVCGRTGPVSLLQTRNGIWYMAVPTANLSFDEPIRFVVPMIRAALTAPPDGADGAGGAGVPRGDMPEVAVLADCRTQFGAEGLNQLTVGLPVAAAAAVNMKAALLKADPLALIEQFAVGMAVENAVHDTGPDAGPDVLWEHAASIVSATVSGDLTRQPAIEDVLSDVNDKHGTHGLFDLLVCLAQFTAGVLGDIGSAALRERVLGLIEGHLDKFTAYLRTAAHIT